MVTEMGSSCSNSVTTTPSTFAASGGSGSVVVTTNGPTCSWAVYSTVPWIQVNSAAATGSGSGLIPFKVGANLGLIARAGNLFVADKNCVDEPVCRSVGSAATSYTTVTYAAGLFNPTGLAFSTAKGLIIAESTGARIREVDVGGAIHTIAGGGGSASDGIAATSARLNTPTLVAVDRTSETIYFADADTFRVRSISAGLINTVAGSGSYGYTGDGGPATAATLGQISGLAVDSNGNLYIGDAGHGVIRKATSGSISTIAGGGSQLGDGILPTQASLIPNGLAVSRSGDIYVADSANGGRIRKISGAAITTVAGGGTVTGNGIPASSAQLSLTGGIALESSGAIYFSEPYRIRKITPDGLLYTVSSANQYASSVVLDNAGYLYFVRNNDTITQASSVPNFCSYSITGAAPQLASGGSATMTVTTAAGCTWIAATTAPGWLLVVRIAQTAVGPLRSASPPTKRAYGARLFQLAARV